MKRSISIMLRTALTAVMLTAVMLTAVMLTSCQKSPINKKGVYSDGYVTFTLPKEHIIAADTTDEMGSSYHKYLLFKGGRDLTGSNIIYMAFETTRSAIAAADVELEDVEAKMRGQYEEDGKQFESVNFKKLDIPGCVGFVYEYRVTTDGKVINHIMYSVVRKAQLEAVTIFFNCTTDELLEEYRASCDTISITRK